MGLIQSLFCSITFCLERVLTWACCAFVLIMLMFTIIMLMVYGISVGYHYAQKELAAFAMSSRASTEASSGRRSGPDQAPRPVVRLLAVNRSQAEQPPAPMLEVYQNRRSGEQLFMDTTETAIVMLETERSPKETELSANERDLARRLIGRFRRSRQNMTTSASTSFFRALKITVNQSLITN